MKHITDMIPLATGNIRQKKRSKPRRSMNAAKLNTTRKRRNWINSMNCKSKTGKRLFQYIENLSGDVYRLSLLFMEILKKYLPDAVEEKRQDKPIKQNEQEEIQNTPEDSMNILI